MIGSRQSPEVTRDGGQGFLCFLPANSIKFRNYHHYEHTTENKRGLNRNPSEQITGRCPIRHLLRTAGPVPQRGHDTLLGRSCQIPTGRFPH